MAGFLIACGGTGGHLSPGIALAERLVTRGHHPSLVVSRREVDSRLCRKYRQFAFIRTPAEPFSWNPLRMIRFAGGQLSAYVYAFNLLRKNRPDAIIAFGGYTSLAIALAGVSLQIPLVLHEANRRPGKAIRWLARLADLIYLPEGVRLRGLHGGKVRFPGYPIRKEIRRQTRDSARQALGLTVTGKLLVVIGGSQGASALNEWVRNNLQALGEEGIHVYCITGIGKGSEGVFEYHGSHGRTVRTWFTAFSDRVGDVLSAADLVVSRAGAGAIAELVHCHTPSILIPYPFASDNHQGENARFLEMRGGCLVVEQPRIRELFAEVRELIFNDWLLERFSENLRRLDQGDSAERIVSNLESLLATRRERAVLRGTFSHH